MRLRVEKDGWCVPVRRAAWVEAGEGAPRGAEAASGEVGGRGCCLVECLEGLLQKVVRRESGTSQTSRSIALGTRYTYSTKATSKMRVRWYVCTVRAQT